MTDCIAVIVPTIDGREDHLARCLEAYEATWHNEGIRIATVVVRNRPTCGIAWQEGVDHVLGGRANADDPAWEQRAAAGRGRVDFLHFTADDLVPHAGWATAAIEAVRQGHLPAPHVLSADGRTQSAGGAGDGVLWQDCEEGRQSPWCAVPFLPAYAWRGGVRLDMDLSPIGPMVPLHYYTDDWFSYRARRAGWNFKVAGGYLFTHYDARVGRGAGMTQAERAMRDQRDFHRYIIEELEVAPCNESLLPAQPGS